MTKFEVHMTRKGMYRFLHRFNTRFSPVVLVGNECDTFQKSLEEIKQTRMQILDNNNLHIFTGKGMYQFVVLSPEGSPLAYSRIFQTSGLLRRVLRILQQHIKLEMKKSFKPRSLSQSVQ
jgi:hypothetical protein